MTEGSALAPRRLMRGSTLTLLRLAVATIGAVLLAVLEGDETVLLMAGFASFTLGLMAGPYRPGAPLTARQAAAALGASVFALPVGLVVTRPSAWLYAPVVVALGCTLWGLTQMRNQLMTYGSIATQAPSSAVETTSGPNPVVTAQDATTVTSATNLGGMLPMPTSHGGPVTARTRTEQEQTTIVDQITGTDPSPGTGWRPKGWADYEQELEQRRREDPCSLLGEPTWTN